MFFEVPEKTRQEIKFVAYETESHRLLNWIRHHPACLSQEYPDRQVNNLYFDSDEYSSYWENISGSSSRAKVRYRWYGNEIRPQPGVLEIKCKRNLFSWKLQFPIDEALLGEGGSWIYFRRRLTEALPPEGKRWLHDHSLPVLLNRYKRKYFVTRDRAIRITLDTQLKVFDQTRKAVPNFSHPENLPRTVVLEIKFDRRFKQLASNLIQGIPVRASRHSKYTVGVINIHGL